MQALSSIPRQWTLELEAEKDAEAGEIDLALQEQIEEENDEQLDVSIASELALDYVSFMEIPEDNAKIPALNPVPKGLEEQFAGYERFGVSSFNRHRGGGAVVETTVSGDRSNALRFFGYLSKVHKQVPDMKLLASPKIGEWAQAWVEYLRARSLKGSSLSNYLQSLIQLCAFANSLLEEGSPDPPVQELLNLRKQAETLAKQDSLYAKKHDSWMDWEDVQRVRVKAIERYYASETTGRLRDVLIIGFHSLQAPDRVGVVRRSKEIL